MEEKILTADQVAQNLQVHPFTVLKFIKQGKLKASKLGRVYRIRESDVARFLDEQQANSHNKTQRSKSIKVQDKDVSQDSLPLVSASKEEALLPETLSNYEQEALENEAKTINKQTTTREDDDRLGFDHYILD